MSKRERLFQLIEKQATQELSKAEACLHRAELGAAALAETSRRPGTLDPAILSIADHLSERISAEVTRLRVERDERVLVRRAASTDRRRFEILASRQRELSSSTEARREQRAYDDLAGTRRSDK
ncbi:MAG: hypothetical protein HY791_25120 [Deltaproteobacteria bacterium]|nr:hypothetical protein [Deltaproteobacteria bacterium]